jgi:EAL domain-containing protein (putative c-di-GMP-specific phosphodiesterase class I)
VKEQGRNGHCQFEPRFDDMHRKRVRLETIVRDAVAKKSFQLYFQPLFKSASGELKGFEALLRLQDENGTFIAPGDFIPVAEHIGLIDEIGSWVLEQACAVAANWPKHLQISVNLSAAQFKRQSVCKRVRHALAKSRLNSRQLILEITESLLMSDTESILAQLKDLKALGISIAMDDFGTGYSSLGYMLKFPFDCIKIDRAFVNALTEGSESALNVVQTIITLGHTMNMSVTAEGVETQEQAQALRDLNCDDVQGFLFGRPMPQVDVAALILKTYAKSRGTDDVGMRQRAELNMA